MRKSPAEGLTLDSLGDSPDLVARLHLVLVFGYSVFELCSLLSSPDLRTTCQTPVTARSKPFRSNMFQLRTILLTLAAVASAAFIPKAPFVPKTRGCSKSHYGNGIPFRPMMMPGAAAPRSRQTLLRAEDDDVLYQVSKKISLINEATEWVKGQENKLTIDLPSGAVDGDLLVLVLGTSGRKPDKPTGGWTFIDSFSKDERGNCSLYAYYKVYEEGIQTSYSYKDGNRKFASLLILRGVNTDPEKGPIKASDAKKTAHSRMKVGETRKTIYPSVKSNNKGAALVLAQYDDVVTIKNIKNEKGEKIYIISKNQRGDDGLISAIDATESGETGEYLGKFVSEDGGLVFVVEMTVTLRPAKK